MVLVFCLGAIGCGGPSDKIKVSGTVTWKGQPIEQGFVTFHPVDPQFAPEAGPIVDGEFSFLARPGKNRVEVHATKESGFNEAMRQPNLVQYIPAKYNEQSSLTEDVSIDGTNRFEYHLNDEG